MNSLRNLPISRRLWLILAVAILMLVTLGVLMLRQNHADLYAGKVLKTQHVVESVAGILKHYQGLESAGTLKREQAQKQAMELIRGLRYDQDDYFWINDLAPKMIMHPTNPKLEGQDLSTLKDPDGKALFNEMVKIAKAKGAGMADYRWPKPGASAPVPKVSYVELFEPYNSEAAIKVINESSRASQLTVEQARQASESLNLIGQSLRNLTGLNASIARATLQQSHVVEDINQNVTQAASLAHSNALTAEQSSDASQHLNQLAEELNRLLGQFRV